MWYTKTSFPFACLGLHFTHHMGIQGPFSIYNLLRSRLLWVVHQHWQMHHGACLAAAEQKGVPMLQRWLLRTEGRKSKDDGWIYCRWWVDFIDECCSFNGWKDAEGNQETSWKKRYCGSFLPSFTVVDVWLARILEVDFLSNCLRSW